MTQPQGQVLLAMLVDSRRFHMILQPVELSALPLNERARATFSWSDASSPDGTHQHHVAAEAAGQPPVLLTIRREHLLMDTLTQVPRPPHASSSLLTPLVHTWYIQVLSCDPISLRYGVRVVFDGEEGQDEGGLLRELLQLFGDALLKPIPEPSPVIVEVELEASTDLQGGNTEGNITRNVAPGSARGAEASPRLPPIQEEPQGKVIQGKKTSTAADTPPEPSPAPTSTNPVGSGGKRKPSLFKLTVSNAAQPEPCTTSVKLSDIPVYDSEAPPLEDGSIEISGVRVGHHAYYQGVGRVVGLALRGGDMLGIHFATFFLKQVLRDDGLSPEDLMQELQREDPVYHRSLQATLDLSVADLGLDGVKLTRCVSSSIEVMGEPKEEELIPGGSCIDVTDHNKAEYVQRQLEHKLVTSIAPQCRAFREGLLDMIPKEALLQMTVDEIQEVLAGCGDLDLAEWKQYTRLTGLQVDSPEVVFFWEILEQDLTRVQREALLQFVTSCRRLPIGGFACLNPRFELVLSEAAVDTRLPEAHTCANSLVLPKVSSKEVLLANFKVVLGAGVTGFGVA